MRSGATSLAAQVQGNRRLEIIWTAAPAITLAIIFVLVIGTMRTVFSGSGEPASSDASSRDLVHANTPVVKCSQQISC
jgi:heme/copper-type cytochrome/quinol oxidase subunit 2